MIDDISLLVWQTKELCRAFPDKIIDVHAGYIITNNEKYQDFRHRLAPLGLHVNYDETYNYHCGQMSFDAEDWRIQVSTTVITRPASDFPGGSYETYNGTDDVITWNAQYAQYALCKYKSNYVVNIDNLQRDFKSYIQEYVIKMHIQYPIKSFSVCMEGTSEYSYTYNTNGSTVKEHTTVITVSDPVHYEAKYTEEDLELLVTGAAQCSRPAKKLKL